MGHNLEGRLRTLEDRTPRGYSLYDREGNVVLKTALSAKEWLRRTFDLLRSRRAAKTELLDQLRRSVPTKESGMLPEYLLAIFEPLQGERPPISAPGKRAKR